MASSFYTGAKHEQPFQTLEQCSWILSSYGNRVTVELPNIVCAMQPDLRKCLGKLLGLRLEPFHYKLLTAAFKEMLNNMDVWM